MTSAPVAPDRDPATLSLAEQYVAAGLDEDLLAGLAPGPLRLLLHDWSFWRRPAQTVPGGDWSTWYVQAGRGYGKTRTGAETLRERVLLGDCAHPGLIAPTAADARDVMVEGESGILAVSPDGQRPLYEPSKRRLTWPNGTVAAIYSADEPDRLRGPQHDWLWGDEPASWRHGKDAWDNASLGLRLGDDPRCMLTGTPKPTPWLRELAASPSTVVTRGTTYENLANLAPRFIAEVLGRYEGTRLGRQELHGLFLDDVEGALWVEATIDAHRVSAVPLLGDWRTVIGVDPPGETAECGIVTARAPRRPGPDSHAYVVADDSLAGRPEEWGAQVVTAWQRSGADAVVVEANQGGDMCRAVIHAVDQNCPVRKVRASESKKSRAEPVAALYERGRVHHVGFLPALESQLVTWVPDESKSPDRLDALVHAVTDLLPIAPPRLAVVASPARARLPGPPGARR